ncbi:MAG: DUF4178 domain-containing protein [Elusimicrobia bacterium]|nr:DUF4178 domain-containing protein [Elusimicrobiota bacterium]
MSGKLRCPKCSCPLDEIRLPERVTVESCPHCYGVFYDRGELALALELSGAADTQWSCPKCERPLRTGRYRDALELEECTACGGLWFDAGEVAKLRKASGVEGLVKGEGAAAGPAPPLLPPAAVEAFTRKLEEQRRALHGEARSNAPAAAAAQTERAFPEIPDGGSADNPDESADPVATYEGRRYRHFQTSQPVVTYVVGEFPWKVKVGEKSRARDFVCPPHLLSQEVTGKDSVWTHGRYLEPEEVWAAFKLPGSPPARVGVAPAQPNPYEASWAGLTAAFFALAAAAVGLAIAIALQASGETVFERSFSYDPAAVEKSVVTEVFELRGHTANVEVALNTSLNNQWAYFSLALINADTDVALDFGRDVAYYQGSEDGEAWSEGSQVDVAYLPRVPSGRYYLRIEPETDASTGPFGFTLRLRRDVARASFAVVALILLALPVLWFWWRRNTFEQSRWVESDHPWGGHGGDEDDE